MVTPNFSLLLWLNKSEKGIERLRLLLNLSQINFHWRDIRSTKLLKVFKVSPRAGHGAPHGRHAVRKLLLIKKCIYPNSSTWCFSDVTHHTLSHFLSQRITRYFAETREYEKDFLLLLANEDSLRDFQRDFQTLKSMKRLIFLECLFLLYVSKYRR